MSRNSSLPASNRFFTRSSSSCRKPAQQRLGRFARDGQLHLENSVIQSSLECKSRFAMAAKIPTLWPCPESPESIVRMAALENLLNAPEFTVSELSSALKRTVED